MKQKRACSVSEETEDYMVKIQVCSPVMKELTKGVPNEALLVCDVCRRCSFSR